MIVWLLFACRSDVTYEGTLVGNAGSGKGKLARTTGLECSNPNIQVSEMRYIDASGNVQSTETIDEDLFAGIPIPDGSPSQLQLDLGTFSITCAQHNQEEMFSFPDTTISISMLAALVSDNYIIELGEAEWLRTIEPRNALQNGSAIFIDVDGDGLLSTEEEAEVLGRGDERSLDEEDRNDTGDEHHDEEEEESEDEDTGQ